MVSFKEFLAELDQATLKSYKAKAEKDVADLETVGEYKDIARNLINKRKKGVATADKKITEGAKVRGYTDKDGVKKYEVLNSKGVTVKNGMSKDIATKYLQANRATLSE
jgi:hypothetical protein